MSRYALLLLGAGALGIGVGLMIYAILTKWTETP